MKLLTHNMLMSPGTRNGYPLAIEVEKMEVVESEFNAEFMVRMVDKIDYSALLTTIRAVRARSTASCMKSFLNFLRSLPIHFFSSVPHTACSGVCAAACCTR